VKLDTFRKSLDNTSVRPISEAVLDEDNRWVTEVSSLEELRAIALRESGGIIELHFLDGTGDMDMLVIVDAADD
jgi:hypothetical protein